MPQATKASNFIERQRLKKAAAFFQKRRLIRRFQLPVPRFQLLFPPPISAPFFDNPLPGWQD